MGGRIHEELSFFALDAAAAGFLLTGLLVREPERTLDAGSQFIDPLQGPIGAQAGHSVDVVLQV